MATKFFLATCKSKKTKHPKGDFQIQFPVTGTTQVQAKEAAWAKLSELDEQGTIEFFQVPALSRIEEDEYNSLLEDDLSQESELDETFEEYEQDTSNSDREWPQLNESGFYPKDAPDRITSSIKEGDLTAAIAVIEAKSNVWVMGYQYVTPSAKYTKPCAHENGEFETLEDAITEAAEIIHNLAEFQSQHGEEKEFATKVYNFCFYDDLMSQLPSEPEPIEDQMDVEEVATLPHQLDIDVAVFDLSETKRLEMAIKEVDGKFYESVEFTDSANPSSNEGNIRTFTDKGKTTEANAITHAMGKAGDWLFRNGDMKAGKSFFSGNLYESFKDAIKYQIVLNVDEQEDLEEPEEIEEEALEEIETNVVSLPSKVSEHDSHDEMQVIVKGFLEPVDNAHLELSAKDFQSAAAKLEIVIGELRQEHKNQLNIVYTLQAFGNHEWTDSSEIIACFMNIRVLRSIMKSKVVLNQVPKETWKYPQIHKALKDLVDNMKTLPESFVKQNADRDEMIRIAYQNITSNLTDETNIDELVKAISTIKNPSILTNVQVVNFVNGFTVANDEEQAQSEPEPTQSDETEEIEQSQEEVEEVEPEATESETKESEPQEPEPVPAKVTKLDPEYLKKENLELWSKGFHTDLNFTKQDPSSGRTSITTQYRIMKCTEIFGPVGIGWGYEVLREWIVKGAPMIINGDINPDLRDEVHKVEIRFWYMKDGKRAEFTQYGDTRKLYMARGGYFVHDDECEKKSLSDALGKAMSMIGISADIYLGMHDDDAIKLQTAASKQAAQNVRALEHEAKETEKALNKAKSYTDKMESAPSLAEIKRLEKIALAALEALPIRGDAAIKKKEKAIEGVKEKAQTTIDQYKAELTQNSEVANG
ncbi:hypothetical protein [Vibrio astriarenae]|uniref:hypothetical protein n=1 Tax=Vibrio astriarenae TaxID=1481923 RepID=UPI00373601D7